MLDLCRKLTHLYDLFHVSQMRKYVYDLSHVIEEDVRDNLIIETCPGED